MDSSGSPACRECVKGSLVENKLLDAIASKFHIKLGELKALAGQLTSEEATGEPLSGTQALLLPGRGGSGGPGPGGAIMPPVASFSRSRLSAQPGR